jgi:hypothetical protein
MPFENHLPRSFTANSIRVNAPALSGVYGLSNARAWVFIGEADNIQDALLGHLNDPGNSIGQLRPTGFVFEICDRAVRSRRQDRLVQEYEPGCNRR